MDRGAAVRAVLDVMVRPSARGAVETGAESAVQPGEGGGQDAVATRKDVEDFLAGAQGAPDVRPAIVEALKGLAAELPAEAVTELDFVVVKEAARRVPRVAGQRVEWVRGMGLDAMLARHLPPGTLDDGYAEMESRGVWEGL